MQYRHHVDQHMQTFLHQQLPQDVIALINLGIAHEQQHQELLLMDILHLFSQSPLKPSYDHHWPKPVSGRAGRFIPVHGGNVSIGHAGNDFAFDNEAPSHTIWLEPFDISDRLVSNGEWLTFMLDGGYTRSAREKSISPKYFYDATGSDLFEQICHTPEYYPTRTETALLHSIATEIGASIPPGAVLIEFGSGASAKTRIVFDASPHLAAYMPIDISTAALDNAVQRLSQHYPTLHIQPLVGDFTQPMELPAALHALPKVGFFPGSTIGNFTHEQAVTFLKAVAHMLGQGARLVIGVDMIKATETLIAAYDDAQGITERFNKNLLVRINNELGGDFDLDAFGHEARWNAAQSRMEMHLVSHADQLVNAAGHTFAFRAGETLHTENSHKFTVTSFTELAMCAGWTVQHAWISPEPVFGVFSLVAD